MDMNAVALNLLRSEAHALLNRIERMESFALHTPMVPAAAIPLPAQTAIENHLSVCRRKLRNMVINYLKWLESPAGKQAPCRVAHRRFSFLRLRFVAILTHLDIFADVLNQRSEHDTGVWLSGLDVFAADALNLPGNYYKIPPVICYLERGPGAAIRRARTRLPGGEQNPVAVIQVPRERMIGSGIASSLVHEVGHQGSVLLDLIGSIQIILRKMAQSAGEARLAWTCWERWISEILADLWSVSRLGIIGTVGLMAVVGLPRAFVFRVNLDDPHPAPYIRVKLSCAMGQALYPDPQWQILLKTWESFYPHEGLDSERQKFFALLDRSIPRLVTFLLNHTPKMLRGRSLGEVLFSEDRTATRLRNTFNTWRSSGTMMRAAPPSLAFAVIGQAKIDGQMNAAAESRLLGDLLKYWVLKITLDTSAICAEQQPLRGTSLQRNIIEEEIRRVYD